MLACLDAAHSNAAQQPAACMCMSRPCCSPTCLPQEPTPHARLPRCGTQQRRAASGVHGRAWACMGVPAAHLPLVSMWHNSASKQAAAAATPSAREQSSLPWRAASSVHSMQHITLGGSACPLPTQRFELAQPATAIGYQPNTGPCA